MNFQYNSDKNIEKWSIEEKNIQQYWEELFGLINKIVMSFDEDKLKLYFDKQKIIWWEKLNDSVSDYNKFKSDFILNFIQNNLLFTLKTWLRTVFDWLKINIWEVTDDYFRNTWNKDDFWETLHDVFLEK